MSEEVEQFEGFPLPYQNWSKLPHVMIDLLPTIRTVAELKVVLYILRHTWGFSEFEKPKKITVDEFANGRKRRDGTRMDAGTGLTPPAIRSGLREAVSHNLIEVEVDDSDLGRVRKFYTLKILRQGEKVLPPGELGDLGGKSFTPRGKKFFPRTEKETIERKIWKETLQELSMQLTQQTFNSWLHDSHLANLQEGSAVVLLKNQHAVEWCTSRLTDTIARTLSGIVGQDVEVAFTVAEEG